MSQTEKANMDNEIDYQLGVEDLDMSGSIADDDDVMRFKYESEAIFKRLAEDIYESAEAGLREPLTNSITTSRRVINDGLCDNPVIEITVQDGKQQKLRLRDMGEGISHALLEEVLLYIGRSTARDDGELSGQYGMGFLASYTLVGMNGGFIMHTNSRKSDDGPYTGLFKPGAFEPDKNNEIPSLLDENEYGTVFEYFLKPDIEIADVREWVDKHSRYSPIPIIYRELDENGEEQYNEDYYATTLKDVYEGSPSLYIDTPYYEAATSPAANNDIILISSPVNMSGKRSLRSGLPWGVDLRLKYENGIVVKGPHEGLIPVSEKQYEMMDDERKEKHVSKTELTKEDLTLPEATGTRERVRRHREFLQHVNEQLKEKYFKVVRNTLDSFDPNEGLTSATDMQNQVFMRIFKHFDKKDEYSEADVRDKLDSEYNYTDVDDNLVEFIFAMTQEVSIISDGKNYSNRYPRRMAYKLSENDSKIFMCVSSNSWKADAVEISPQETDIVKINKADDYDAFEKHLGWIPLKNIKKSNADEMLNLDEEQIEKLTNRSKTTDKNIDGKRLTVHHASGGRNTFKRKADTLISHYKNIDTTSRSTRYGDILVLFPLSSEHKVSDYYHMANKRCCVASVKTKKMTEYLTGNAEGIMTYEEYVNWVKSQKIITSKGLKKIKHIMDLSNSYSRSKNVVLTPKSNVIDSYLNNRNILESMAEQIKPKYSNFDSVPLYGVVDISMMNHIESIYTKEETKNIHVLATTDSYNAGYRYSSSRYENELKLFAKASLTEEQYESKEIKKVISMFDSLNDTSVNMIRMLSKSHEQTGEFASERDTEDKNIRMPTVKTKFGEMTFDKLEKHVDYSDVVVHVVENAEDLIKLEQDDIIHNIGKEMQYMNDIKGLESLDSEVVYVPMQKLEYMRISDYIHEDVTVIGRGVHTDIKYNIYARTKLSTWDDTDMINCIKRKCNFTEFTNIVDSMIPAHNSNSEIQTKSVIMNPAKKLL